MMTTNRREALQLMNKGIEILDRNADIPVENRNPQDLERAQHLVLSGAFGMAHCRTAKQALRHLGKIGRHIEAIRNGTAEYITADMRPIMIELMQILYRYTAKVNAHLLRDHLERLLRERTVGASPRRYRRRRVMPLDTSRGAAKRAAARHSLMREDGA